MTLPTPGEILSDSSLMHPTEVLAGDQNDPEGWSQGGAEQDPAPAQQPPGHWPQFEDNENKIKKLWNDTTSTIHTRKEG